VRFVPSRPGTAYYEIEVFESGRVPTRADSLHDLFNALAWLAFPRTKARINAMHVEEIPREGGQRGRKRDLLTLLDEGGVIVACSDPALMEMIRGFRWKELFWDNRSRVLRSLRFAVLGHGVLEKALQPWPGVTCKAMPVGGETDFDAAAAALLAALPANATPRNLPVVPVFGYPGWDPGSHAPGFYDDTRYFRPAARYGNTG
jgi:hypothetical protein